MLKCLERNVLKCSFEDDMVDKHLQNECRGKKETKYILQIIRYILIFKSYI